MVNDNRTRSLLEHGLATVLGLVILVPMALGQEQVFSHSAYVQLGGEYSSNLQIEELEWASDESDAGMLVEGGIEASWQPRDRWRIDGGYQYSGSHYRDMDRLDLSSHMLYTDGSYDLDLMTVGGNYYFTDASLDGEGFLRLHEVSLYMGRMLEDDWYVRAALNFADKDFGGLQSGELRQYREARDADNAGFSVDGYWFFNNGLTSLNVGYDYEEEDTRAARFDYNAFTFRVLFNHNLNLLERNASLKLGHRLQLRDYDSISPSIRSRRDDTRNVLDARITINWLQNLDLIGTLERANYDSDLPSADYNETRMTLSGKLKF